MDSKKITRRAAITGATGLALAGGLAIFAGSNYDNSRKTFNQATSPVTPTTAPEEPAPTTTQALNILLIGTDEADPTTGEARSDSILVLNIPKTRDKATIMSIPRDLYSTITYTQDNQTTTINDRINTAYNIGGPNLSKATIESLLGVTIDHTLVIDFQGFATITEELGGITLNNPTEFTTTARDEPIHYPAGEITLAGEEALWYVRERKAFPNSDLTRVAHQQLFMKALLTELLNNPLRLPLIINKLLPHIVMDENLNSMAVLNYALNLSGIKDIQTFTYPTDGATTLPTGAQVLTASENITSVVTDAFKTDTVQNLATQQEPLQ